MWRLCVSGASGTSCPANWTRCSPRPRLASEKLRRGPEHLGLRAQVCRTCCRMRTPLRRPWRRLASSQAVGLESERVWGEAPGSWPTTAWASSRLPGFGRPATALSGETVEVHPEGRLWARCRRGSLGWRPAEMEGARLSRGGGHAAGFRATAQDVALEHPGR